MISPDQNDQSDGEREQRMQRRSRRPDPEFLPGELLYLRCANSNLDPTDNKRLFADQIKFYPDQSVNRGKYSEQEDVLYPNYLKFGIARFQVQHIPSELKSDGGILFQWRMEHRPVEENYAHSEIWTHKSGEHITNAELPKGIKKQFRQILSEGAEVIEQPKV